MQKNADVSPGETVKVIMELDTGARTVRVPPDLKKALAKDKRARTVFEGLSYTHKKDFVQWVEETKKQETRTKRISKTLEMLKRKTTIYDTQSKAEGVRL